MAESLIVEQIDSVVVITVAREHRRNALDNATLLALRDALNDVAGRDELAAVVLAGAGLKAFSAGSDLKEMASQSPAGRLAHTALGQQVFDQIEELPCATIAAVEGFCLGGGLEMALVCDLRVAGEGSTFGMPEVQVNALPTWGGTYRLPRLLGLPRAKQLLLFGRRLTAAEALEWGLIAEVVPQGAARDRALEIGRSLAGLNRRTFARAKALINAGQSVHPRVARHLEYLADDAQLAAEE